MEIKSYVFFDIETTGLPWKERNQTKIIELSFVATSRNDIMKTKLGDLPPVSKLTLIFNPNRTIHRDVVAMTGLSNELLKYAPTFNNKVNTLISFLEDLPRPICLVAHNGNTFDYKILLAEFGDAGTSLPELYCVDSLVAFRKLLKDSTISFQSLKCNRDELSFDDILTDDDNDEGDNWPEIDISAEDWKEIDDLCESLSGKSLEDSEEHDTDSEDEISRTQIRSHRSSVVNNLFGSKNKNSRIPVNKKPSIGKNNSGAPKTSYKLVDLYKRLLNKEETNAHRAENDSLMLLECVVALKNDFLPWADTTCKRLSDIAPLQRY